MVTELYRGTTKDKYGLWWATNYNVAFDYLVDQPDSSKFIVVMTIDLKLEDKKEYLRTKDVQRGKMHNGWGYWHSPQGECFFISEEYFNKNVINYEVYDIDSFCNLQQQKEANY